MSAMLEAWAKGLIRSKSSLRWYCSGARSGEIGLGKGFGAMKGERGILEKRTEALHRRRKGLGPENKCVVVSKEVPSECGYSGFV